MRDTEVKDWFKAAVSTILNSPTFARLTDKQRAWVRHKANWEHISISAVMRDYTVPSDEELDGNN